MLYQSNLKLNILLVDLQLSEGITPFHCPKELEVDLLKHQKEPLLHALQKKKLQGKLGVMVPACNPNTWAAETGLIV